MCDIDSNKILFRGFHPSEIYLDAQGNCKVTEFCQAVLISENKKRKTIISFPEYFSPEQIQNAGYDEKMEIWQFGCLLFELCQGISPFFSQDPENMLRKIKQGKIAFSQKIPISDDLKDLILQVS